MKRKHKQYFIYYIKENVLIFDVFDYIEEIAADYVDYCYEWNIISNYQASTKPVILNGFFEANFVNFALKLSKLKTDLDCYILFYYNPKNNYNEWSKFFKNPDFFIKKAKNFLKKKLWNFIELKEEREDLFKTIKGSYKNIPCLIPSGEDESFLLKNVKNLK
jgi:hypothetical protein